MIFVAIVCLLVWKSVQGERKSRLIRVGVVGVLITGLVAITAASLPMMEIPTGPDQELRVMPPAGFPFTMQQFRDYDTNQFTYRIVLGWPDGIPLFEGMLTDDQSEYIHLAHLVTAEILTVYLLIGTVIVLGSIYILERNYRN